MSLSKRDYDAFKGAIDKMVNKYINRDRSSVISIIMHSVDTGQEKRKLEDKLLGYVDDKNIAYKVSDKTFMILEDLGIKVKTSSRKRHKEDGLKEKDSKKPRKDDGEFIPSMKAKEEITPMQKPAASAHLQAQQIKDMMAKAQATIEERKKALSMHVQGPPPPTNGAVSTQEDISQRIARLQARLETKKSDMLTTISPTITITPASTGLLPGGIPPVGLVSNLPVSQMPLQPPGSTLTTNKTPLEPAKPTPLILDAEGRTVDLSGKEVHLIQRVPTLKANIRAKKREEFKQQLQEKPVEESSESNFFDHRVPLRPFVRAKKNVFKFHEEGKHIQYAQRERAKARLEKLQEQISTVAKKTGISSAAKLAQLEQREQELYDITPDIEWWDAIILQNDRYPDEGDPVKVKDDFITNLVEHPMEMKCPSDLSKGVELQVFLTRKERKKLRRMNRRETWKEKQEKIRLGLEPPPEPKVRMANLMRVLGTEAVLDPTKMEKHVREQMAKRLKAHEDANAARKLTPEQKRDKKMKKIKEDTSAGVKVAIYRVTDLTNGAHKFKIERNAGQLFMTGTVVMYKDVNVIVVEGGPKQQKKYRRLMMERIKWAEESRAKDSSVEPKCQLIWEGVVPERSFGELQFKGCPSEIFAREHFKKYGVEHYWDLAYGRKVLEEAEEGS